MSRLSDRLKSMNPFSQAPPQQGAYQQNPYQEEQHQQEEGYLPDQQDYNSPLVQEYYRNQIEAQEQMKKEMKLAEATNPHQLYTDIVTNPSPPKQYEMKIMGRPIDVNALEQYLIFKISPRTITTLMRYNDAKSIEEIKGYGRRPPVRASKGIGLLLLVGIGALLMMAVGYLFLNGTIPNMMRGMMGGFMP